MTKFATKLFEVIFKNCKKINFQCVLHNYRNLSKCETQKVQSINMLPIFNPETFIVSWCLFLMFSGKCYETLRVTLMLFKSKVQSNKECIVKIRTYKYN